MRMNYARARARVYQCIDYGCSVIWTAMNCEREKSINEWNKKPEGNQLKRCRRQMFPYILIAYFFRIQILFHLEKWVPCARAYTHTRKTDLHLIFNVSSHLVDRPWIFESVFVMKFSNNSSVDVDSMPMWVCGINFQWTEILFFGAENSSLLFWFPSSTRLMQSLLSHSNAT